MSVERHCGTTCREKLLFSHTIKMNYHAFKLAICGRRGNLAFTVRDRITAKSTGVASAAGKIFLSCNWREKKYFLLSFRMTAAFAHLAHGNTFIFLVIQTKIWLQDILTALVKARKGTSNLKRLIYHTANTPTLEGFVSNFAELICWINQPLEEVIYGYYGYFFCSSLV